MAEQGQKPMERLITLRGGLTVRVEAIALGCRLEAKGHTLTAKDGRLTVINRSALTPADVALIREHLPHLVAAAAYVATEMV
jgi:hypothetical protein